MEIDTNYWKPFVYERLATAMGDPGRFSIFGRNLARPGGAVQHRLFGEHLTTEYRVRTGCRGRTVHEWKLSTHEPDNHWLDCLVGCAAAACIQGAVLYGTDARHQPERPRLKLSELRRARQM